MKTFAAILVFVLADSSSNIFFTKGMKQVGEVSTLRPRQLLAIGRRAFSNRPLHLGILSAAISFFTFLGLLTWADLSFVQPTLALGYVASVLGAKYILKERVNASRWLGTLCICAGVALISM
jgi:transporter family protein